MIGAMLLSKGAVIACAEEVSPEDFYKQSHGKMFRAALSLHARGEPVDAVTLIAELERRGELEEVGGMIRVREVAGSVPGAANARHYARLVRECAQRRALLVDLQRASQKVLASEWAVEEAADALRAIADARALSEPEQQIRVLSLREFVDQPLAGTEPLLGEGKDRLIVPGGLNILGGSGGVGKTTLAMHLTFHLAAGVPWLNIPVQRPCRMLLLENEGPHDLFAEKMGEFRARWDGPSVDDQIVVHDAPWGRFTWDDRRKAAELRAICRDLEIDMVVANPLSRLGMKGAGTPEETNMFLDLLVAGGLGEDFGVILIHHTRKPSTNGRQASIPVPVDELAELSGAWGPHPDFVMILSSTGARSVRLTMPKVRWGEQGNHGPFVLEFEEDPGRPVGYKPFEASKNVTDGVLFERIDKVLVDAKRPLHMTDIRRLVIGNGQRISEIVKKGVAMGRYGTDGRGKARYWLLDSSEPVLADWSTVKDVAGELADESGSHLVALSEIRDRLDDEGYVS